MNVEDGNVHLLRNKNFPLNGNGLSLDPEYLVTGRNSGYQAINLAVLAGAKMIILLGYDSSEPQRGKPTHWFGDHPRREPDNVFAIYRQSFKVGAKEIIAAGVRVINCSPGSAVDAFEKMELEQALQL